MKQPSYQSLYEAVVPSVVSIYRDPGQRGAGSGFFYTDTHLLTNEHVVRERDRVDIRFHDGSWETGTVVGSDVYTDLAVIRVTDTPADTTPLQIAEHTAYPQPGQPVAALGNPLGLDGSVTTGVVSGVDRSMPTSGGFAIPDIVQVDAPINPGNSGGPLITAVPDTAASGEEYPVVGVNRAKSGDNIGFAVSARVISEVVPELINTGRYQHSYLCVQTLDVTPRIAKANGLDTARGVIVVNVRQQTNGERLNPSRQERRVDRATVPVGGDIIVGIGDQSVRSHEELTRCLLTETEPGTPVMLDIVRRGQERRIKTVPAERPVAGDDRKRASDSSTTIPIN
jgi:Trypsin-like serine proteases, typically periplasmic, contain C-terminal PDZ domain